MKIYNKVIYDKDNNIIFEDSFNYNGPIAKTGPVGGIIEDLPGGSDVVKGALIVGAIATGFAAIPAIGPSAFVTSVFGPG